MHATEKFWQVCSVSGKSSASKDELILPFLPCQVRGKLSRNLQTYGSQDISAPTSGGLYIGGIPFHMKDFVEKSGSVSSINGFVGTISDLSFIDEL